jgi:hypothetical protein
VKRLNKQSEKKLPTEILGKPFVKPTKQKRTSAISFANHKETPFLNIIDQFHVYVQFSVHNKALHIHLKN